MHKNCQYFELNPVANHEKVEEIIKSGAASVGLNATLDELDIEELEVTKFGDRWRRGLGETIATLFSSDDKMQEIDLTDLSNLNAKLILSFNKRKKGNLTQEEFDQVACEIADEKDRGIFIKLPS